LIIYVNDDDCLAYFVE